ncbi:MAG: GNAT family N-acetyltransferase [Aureispira sp.]
MNDIPIIQTARLELRLTSQEDAAFILELLNTPKWIQNIGDRQVTTIQAAKRYIQERMLPQVERLGFGNFTLVRIEDGKKVGTCGLYDREGLEGVDIGFALLPAYERMGYAFESAQKLLHLAEHQWKLSLVQGITIAPNTSSRKLLEKLGLQFIEYIRLPNDTEELMLYRRVFESNA